VVILDLPSGRTTPKSERWIEYIPDLIPVSIASLKNHGEGSGPDAAGLDFEIWDTTRSSLAH
jgi:hypothetical protein